MATRSAVVVFSIRTSSVSYAAGWGAKGNHGGVHGRSVDLEELTYGVRGGAVVVGGGRERHVFVIGCSGLRVGHDIVKSLLEERPSSGEVGVWGRYWIDLCGHFVRSGCNLWQREVGERGNVGVP